MMNILIVLPAVTIHSPAGSHDSDPESGSDDGKYGNNAAHSWAFSLCLFLSTLQLFYNVTDGLILYILQFFVFLHCQSRHIHRFGLTQKYLCHLSQFIVQVLEISLIIRR